MGFDIGQKSDTGFMFKFKSHIFETFSIEQLVHFYRGKTQRMGILPTQNCYDYRYVKDGQKGLKTYSR